MNSRFAQLLVRWLFLAIGVTVATKLVHGIRCDDSLTLLVVVLLLSFFNAILRPLLVLLTLPFILLSLGLGVLIINAFLFLLVGHLVDGFHVDGFGAAFWGSVVVTVTGWILNVFLRPSGGQPPKGRPPGGGGPVRFSFRMGGRGRPPSAGIPPESSPGSFPGSQESGGHLPDGGKPGGGDVIDI